jgi:hypothetical protein
MCNQKVLFTFYTPIHQKDFQRYKKHDNVNLSNEQTIIQYYVNQIKIYYLDIIFEKSTFFV